MAQWIIVSIAIGGLIFNSGILYNDIKHLKKEFAEMKQEMKDLRTWLMEKI